MTTNEAARAWGLTLLASRLGRGEESLMKSGGRASKALTDDERRDIAKALAMLEPFHNIRHTMPLQYVRSFLLVALEEGQGVKEYARKAGVSASVMSRHLLNIGERNRHMEKGFGLITFRSNPMELRKHEIFLTDKGRAVAHQILRALRK